MPQFAIESRFDFSGGIDAQSSPHVLSPRHVEQAVNLVFDEQGSMRTREGFTLSDTAAPSTTTHVTFGAFINAGSFALLAVSFESVSGLNKLYQINHATPWTVLGTFQQAYALAQITRFGGTVVMEDAYTPLKFWNGTTFAAISAGVGQTVPPGALHAISHSNQLWLFNTSATRTTLDGPVSLRASDVLNLSSWPNGNQVFLGDDSDKGMGLASFSIAESGIAPLPVLLAFTGFATYQINGTFGGSDFAVQQVRTDQGCLASRSIRFCPGLGVVRLTQRGFYLCDGLNDVCISDSIAPYLFGGRGITPIALHDSGYLSRAILRVGQPTYYLCACPVASDDFGFERVFALNLTTRSWAVWDVPGVAGQGIGAWNMVRGSGDPFKIGSPVVYASFRGSKNVYTFGSPATDDAGTAISWRVRPRVFSQGAPLRRGFHRRMLAKVYNVTQGQTVTGTIAIGPGQQPAYLSGSQALSTSASITAQASSALSADMEVDLNFDILRTGEVQHIELQGAGPITIRGLEWHGVPKPASRPRVV